MADEMTDIVAPRRARPAVDDTHGDPLGSRRRAGMVRTRLRKVRARMRRNATLNTTWRVGVFLVGALVGIAGVVMLVTPGPGWLGIVVGLAILATEFHWADRWLRWARRKAREASRKAFDPAVRRRTLAVVAVVVLLAAAACWWWVAVNGWPTPVRSGLEWLRRLP